MNEETSEETVIKNVWLFRTKAAEEADGSTLNAVVQFT